MLLVGVLAAGWAVVFWELPFYEEMIVAGVASIFIMSLLNERFVFLYAISMALVFGGFLTVYAFIHEPSTALQISYMYSHLLFTAFLLLFWILLNLLKNIGYENKELKRQVQVLQKYSRTTHVLTLPEFKEQAQWLLKSSERNQEESWFVQLNIMSVNKRTSLNLQESLETLAMQTIRQKFDLVTSNDGVIYLLLKNTHSRGIERLLERYWDACKNELNLIEPPYRVKTAKVTDNQHFDRLLGGEAE